MSQEVNQILKIPISSGREDKLVWFHSKNGKFTVKSAYHLHRELATKFSASTSIGRSNNGL